METLRHNVRKWERSRRPAFTLVELLVVITIIGILVALITVAALGAMRTARQGAIKLEINQISGSFDKYKDSAGSYPPNAQTDGPPAPEAPLDDAQVLLDLQRHFRQAFPKHKEPDNLFRVLAGISPTGTDAPNFPDVLAGGMTAAEAVVFWLGGFSSDPLYPISGEGGPAYRIPVLGDGDNPKLDPIESRSWKYEFEITRIGPRDDEGYFPADDDADPNLVLASSRFIEYRVNINGADQLRRINFWQYTPGRSKAPVLYFDVSRHPAAVKDSMGNVIGPYDPPAAPGDAMTPINPFPLHVHALKMRAQSAAAGVPIQFANEGKFQVLHSGVDDDWGADILEKTSAHGIAEALGPAAAANEANYLLFPTGPFTDAAADTIASFITQARLEDAQQ